MSTKQDSHSQELENDLRREVEQNDNDEALVTSDQPDDIDERGDTFSSETLQDESTNDNTTKPKTSRVRPSPNANQLKVQAKRRKTSGQNESSDLNGTELAEVTTAVTEPTNNEPVAGTSGMQRTSKERSSTPKDIRVQNEDVMDEDTSSSEESVQLTHSAKTTLHFSSTEDKHEEAVREEREDNRFYQKSDFVGEVVSPSIPRDQEGYPPTSGSRDVLRTQRRSAERDKIQAPVLAQGRSAVALEEIFRMPIYESDSRGREVAGQRNEDEDTVDQGQEVQGWSRRPGLARQEGDTLPTTEATSYIQSQKSNDDKATSATEEKQRMQWARKVFFMSTELIFPGFTRYTDAQAKKKDYMAIRVRSSWVLQALLYADVLFFVMWFLAFLSTCDIAIAVLKELHGNLIICMTALFTLVNIPRLLFGLKGNETDKIELLALFWMITFIVQGPLFGFILFTDIFTPIRMAFTLTMDAIMMVFICLEVIVGTVHLKNLIRDELKVIELARKCENLSLPAEAGPSNLRPRVVNTAEGPVVDWVPHESTQDENRGVIGKNTSSFVAEESDDDWSTDDSGDEFEKRVVGERSGTDFRLKIRRIRDVEPEHELEEQDRDDSNQVSSTSDSIRQRPIKVI